MLDNLLLLLHNSRFHAEFKQIKEYIVRLSGLTSEIHVLQLIFHYIIISGSSYKFN